VLPPLGARGGARELAAHLTAGGVSLSLRRERVRLSPHFYTQDAEVDRVVALVRDFLG
jgi:selenocysteine lyase/cysteine desulfurase